MIAGRYRTHSNVSLIIGHDCHYYALQFLHFLVKFQCLSDFSLLYCSHIHNFMSLHFFPKKQIISGLSKLPVHISTDRIQIDFNPFNYAMHDFNIYVYKEIFI